MIAKSTTVPGKELPGIPADHMIPSGVTERIIFMNENDDVRSDVGCVIGVGTEVAAIFYTLFETAKLSQVDPRIYITRAARRAVATPGAVTRPSDLS